MSKIMNILIIFEMRFKQDTNILTGILDYYGFKKITETSYSTDLSKKKILKKDSS